jgi:hypothetical protein
MRHSCRRCCCVCLRGGRRPGDKPAGGQGNKPAGGERNQATRGPPSVRASPLGGSTRGYQEGRKRRWRPVGGGARALEAAVLAGGAGWRGRWGGDAEGRVARGPSGDGEAGTARPSWVGEAGAALRGRG